MTKGVACVPEAPLQPLLSAAAVSVLWAAGRMLGAAQRPLDRRDPERGGGTAALTLTRTQQTSVAAHCQAHHHNSLKMHTQLQYKKLNKVGILLLFVKAIQVSILIQNAVTHP